MSSPALFLKQERDRGVWLRHMRWIALLTMLLVSSFGGYAKRGPTPRPLVYLEGSDFTGGAAQVFGGFFYGAGPVNYVYAVPTGTRAVMEASFDLVGVPSDDLYLYLRAREDDATAACHIAIELNDVRIYDGPSGFPSDAWTIHTFPVPASAFRTGTNTLRIRNRETAGNLGMPPWFMVSRAAIARAGYVLRRDIQRDFRFELPKTKRAFPEPLPAGAMPGFAVRGIKGWLWRPEQYLQEIPWLARCRMNFLMNCYGSMCDIEHYAWGDPRVNRWWEPLPEPKKRAFERVVAACHKAGIAYCFSMNPNFCTNRPVRYDAPDDVALLWQHFDWMQRLGVRWFNISLDDISEGIDAAGQARLVNTILNRLRQRDPDVKFVFCPTYYWGDGQDPAARAYLERLARDLDPQVYLFWTGDAVVGPITRKAAESFRRIAKHRLFLWDNYPVNDANPTMHLGPVLERDADLCEVVDGYMSNSMHSQNEMNRIPMFTCADFAYNPRAYDPERSIGQAILQQTDKQKGRELLRDLVIEYPGFLVWGRASTALNPVRERFLRLIAMPHGRPVALAYVERLEVLLQRIERAFPRRYNAEKQTLREDIRVLKKQLDAD